MSSSPDPVATLRDAWRHARQSLSLSSVHGWQETSKHYLHIDGYSTVSTLYGHPKFVESKPFRAGGQRWKLKYYPNGFPFTKDRSLGVELCLMDTGFFGRTAQATAGYTVSILDRDSNLLCSRRAQPQQYSPWGFTGIRLMDATAENNKGVLRHLKDDSLIIRCDLTVHRSEMESRLRWLLRRFLE